MNKILTATAYVHVSELTWMVNFLSCDKICESDLKIIIIFSVDNYFVKKSYIQARHLYTIIHKRLRDCLTQEKLFCCHTKISHWSHKKSLYGASRVLSYDKKLFYVNRGQFGRRTWEVPKPFDLSCLGTLAAQTSSVLTTGLKCAHVHTYVRT
jgi:hypothetical protein